MTLFNYYCYCLNLLILFHTQCLSAYPCYICNPIRFNYSITIDDFPPPTQIDCRIITAETGCFVRVSWDNNNMSAVIYGTNPGFPHNTVKVEMERTVNTSSGQYATYKYVALICSASDPTPCNTVESLKRSFTATMFPSEKQINEYNDLIIPTQTFNSSSCYEFTNMTDVCPRTDLVNCQKCLTAVEYSQSTDICAACPSDEVLWNFFNYDTTFSLTNQTRMDLIVIRCQTGNMCNSMSNVESIQRNLMIQFDYNKFFHSTTSTIRSSLTMVLILLCIELFRLF